MNDTFIEVPSLVVLVKILMYDYVPSITGVGVQFVDDLNDFKCHFTIGKSTFEIMLQKMKYSWPETGQQFCISEEFTVFALVDA